MNTPKNDNALPTFDAVTAALTATFATSAARWIVEGWAAHIRGARHPLHAINSLVKHAGEFDSATWPAAFVLTVARCADGGMRAEDAAAEIHHRRAARAQKALDDALAARAA